MRGQTGEGVSHYVLVSETSKWSPPLSARCRSHSRRAGCRGCGAGVTTANRTRIWCAVAPARAINENAFASACVRCGQCVQACPYDTLKLATLASGLSAGTPYFVARDIPCEMCEDIPCAKVCPSGALDREIESIDDARMGLAVLVDQENCLNFQGLRCDVCYRECPKIDEAITLELERNTRTGKHARFLPTVHSDACTGCGKCEKVCVLEQPAIKVLPLSLAKGELGHHYRFGWLEGNNGKS